jgi:hypothetical protein
MTFRELDGNRTSFRNVVSYSYLEFRTIDTVHKPSDPRRCRLLNIEISSTEPVNEDDNMT